MQDKDIILLDYLKKLYLRILETVIVTVEGNKTNHDTEIDRYKDYFSGVESLDDIHGCFSKCLKSIQVSSGHENNSEMDEKNANLVKTTDEVINMAKYGEYRLANNMVEKICESIAKDYSKPQPINPIVDHDNNLNGPSVSHGLSKSNEPPIITYPIYKNGSVITYSEYENGDISLTRIKDGEKSGKTVTFTPNRVMDYNDKQIKEYEIKDKVCFSKALLKEFINKIIMQDENAVENEKAAMDWLRCTKVDKDGTQHWCTPEEYSDYKREKSPITDILEKAVLDDIKKCADIESIL